MYFQFTKVETTCIKRREKQSNNHFSTTTMTSTTIASTTTADGSKKRRIEEKEATKKLLNPFTVAKEQLDIVSPSLPPELRTSITKACYDILSNLHLCSQKNATLKRLEDKEVIPKSLESKFELQSSKLIKEKTEYTSLQKEVEELQQDHAKKLKEKIKSVNILDRDATFRAAIDILLDNVIKLAKFQYSYSNETKWQPYHIMEIIDDIFHRVDDMRLFFQTEEIDSRAICENLLNYNKEEDPLLINDRAKLKPTRDNFKKLYNMSFEAVIVRYKDAVKEKIKLVRATKAFKEHETDKVAAAVASKIDIEPKYDPDAVRIICREEVDQALSKNYGGGRRSAAKKKKNRQQQEQKKGKKKQKNKRKDNQEERNKDIKSVLKSPSKRKSGRKNNGRKVSFKK